MEDAINISDYLKFLLALGLVIALILGLGVLLRRFGNGFPSAMSRGRRLSVVESMPLDAKHRLVLLKRDDKEHLVILGHGADTVVEKDITPPIPVHIEDGTQNDNKISNGENKHGFKHMLNQLRSGQK